MDRLLAHPRASRVRTLGTATIPPAGAVGLALLLGPDNLAAGTALCLLGVVLAAAIGGRGSGVVASVLALLGLNFFVSEPRHTLMVREPGDLVALLAFLFCALLVGTLVSLAVEAGARAERRATEAQLLSRTGAKLVSGEPLSTVLDAVAEDLVGLFSLSRCEISTPVGAGSSSRDQTGDGPTVTIPLATGAGSFGALTAIRPSGGSEFSDLEIRLLETLAAQTALAIERAALDKQVRDARLESEASQLRAALFSSVTHDLRTPLSSIKASASGLLGAGARYSDSQREEMLRTVVEEADRLNRIVGNLLELARVRSGALVLTKQPVMIDEIVGSVLRHMRRTFERSSIRTNIRPDLPPVDADPVQIEQVLSNLLENAVRFSPPGGEIQISAARWESVVRVQVSDHGPGIPPEERTRVFDEFYGRDATGGRAGTGLGLAIARAVVLAHGGVIRAKGAPGGGTAIVFELPIATEAAVGPEPAPSSGSVP